MRYCFARTGPNRMFRKPFWAQNGNIKPKGGKIKSTQQPSQEMPIYTTKQKQSFFLQKKGK